MHPQHNDLLSILRRGRLQPSFNDRADRAEALRVLNTTILGEEYLGIPGYLASTSNVQGVRFVVALMGSYALGTWDPSTSITCMIAGTISRNTFFKLARSKLREAYSKGAILLKASKQDVNIFEIGINGIRFELQYCQSNYVHKWPKVDSIPPQSAAEEKLGRYLDTLHIIRLTRSCDAFPLAYRAIKLWAKASGVYSKVFGYLNEDMLTIMVTVIYESRKRSSKELAVAFIVQEFFAYYSSFDFRDRAVQLGMELDRPPRSRTIGMEVLGLHAGSTNLARNATLRSTSILQEEITREYCRFHGAWGWCQVIAPIIKLESASFPFTDFIRIEPMYWGRSKIQGGRFVEWVHSQVARFCREYPLGQLALRPWPLRIICDEHPNPTVRFDDTPPLPYLPHNYCYSSYYFIGVGYENCTLPRLSKNLHAELETNVSSFFDGLRSSPQYDMSNSFFEARVLPADFHHTSPLSFDTTDFGLIPAETIRADLEDSEDERATSSNQEYKKPKSKSKAKGKAKSKNSTSGQAPPAASSSTPPLRPALDILNRIRYDTALDTEDYLVGYWDRHTGTQEMPVLWWKDKDNTDEEFIPQSRILYFKRISDRVVVWDRAAKIDNIFGSGVGDGSNDEYDEYDEHNKYEKYDEHHKHDKRAQRTRRTRRAKVRRSRQVRRVRRMSMMSTTNEHDEYDNYNEHDEYDEYDEQKYNKHDEHDE